MKKYLYSLAAAGAFFYSCSPQQAAATTAPENLTKDEMLAKGKATYEQRCNKCHALEDPKEHTAQDWKPIVDAMAPKAKLSAQETSWVMAYVTENAKK